MAINNEQRSGFPLVERQEQRERYQVLTILTGYFLGSPPYSAHVLTIDLSSAPPLSPTMENPKVEKNYFIVAMIEFSRF